MKPANVWERLISLVFPPKCSACGEILPYYSKDVLCERCFSAREEELLYRCGKCKKKVSDCRCKSQNCSDAIEMIVSTAPYTSSFSVTDRIVLAAKDNNDPKLFKFMSDEMVRAAYGNFASLEDLTVTYVPRSSLRKSETGHDQSEKLARLIARELGAEMIQLFKKKGSKQQKKLHAAERTENAESSYVFISGREKLVKGKSFLLCDDVITTGASVSACANKLKAAGADKIYVLTFAKTVKREKSLDKLFSL